MKFLTGTDEDKAEQARRMSDAELAKLAYLNDQPPAMAARGEIARCSAAATKKMLYWGKAAAISAFVAAVATIVTLVMALADF